MKSKLRGIVLFSLNDRTRFWDSHAPQTNTGGLEVWPPEGAANPVCDRAPCRAGVLYPPCFMLVFALIHVATVASQVTGDDLRNQPGYVSSEFIYEQAPFPQCHASTIEQTPTGLAAAWFGGTREGHSDVGIWFSSRSDEGWSTPREVADGVQPDGQRLPCWNPVLFQPEDGPLMLFYKVGPNPREWWGMLIGSIDNGQTWTTPYRLPVGALGPVKNKPVLLDNGTLLCGSSTEHRGWRVHMEMTTDWGKTFHLVGPLNNAEQFGAIQPTILKHGREKLQILCRSRQRTITQCWSSDHGKTWSEMSESSLPNPNSGIDAVSLADGRHLLVYNHTERGRSPLNVAVSRDGKSWNAALVLENEPGEYSYPAVIQADDGQVHVTFTWKRRRVKHVVLDPEKLRARAMHDGQWPQ